MWSLYGKISIGELSKAVDFVKYKAKECSHKYLWKSISSNFSTALVDVSR